MPGAEISNVQSTWRNGALRFQKVANGDDIFVIGATTGLPFCSYNLNVTTVTTAVTLAASTHAGKTIACGVDATVISLSDHASSTSYGASYTIVNTASDGGALVVVKAAGTGSSAWFAAGGTASATTNTVIANTKTTQQYGDFISVRFNGSTSWIVYDSAGTWTPSNAS
jgi:hypothetical protein